MGYDVVIPLLSWKTGEFSELRYCLRSLCLYLPDFSGNVILIGNKPDWVTGVKYIAMPDATGPMNKERNIYRKMTEACRLNYLSDSFYMVHDDHFLMPGYKHEYYYKGTLSDSITGCSDRFYLNTLMNTRELFPEGKDFDTHCPILFKKDKFMNIRADFDRAWGYGVKSVYCNETNIKGKYYTDLKFRTHQPAEFITKSIEDRLYFSLSDKALNRAMLSVLDWLYPEKCRYEI